MYLTSTSLYVLREEMRAESACFLCIVYFADIAEKIYTLTNKIIKGWDLDTVIFFHVNSSNLTQLKY